MDRIETHFGCACGNPRYCRSACGTGCFIFFLALAGWFFIFSIWISTGCLSISLVASSCWVAGEWLSSSLKCDAHRACVSFSGQIIVPRRKITPLFVSLLYLLFIWGCRTSLSSSLYFVGCSVYTADISSHGALPNESIISSTSNFIPNDFFHCRF